MAAAMMSLSESIQASIIIQKSLHPQQKDQLVPAQQRNLKGIGLFVQILLVSALFGIEMVIAFEQIYLILFHQFLGVPVSLLSINGIVCGVVSMTFLPIIGYFSDKGANTKRRKLCSLFVGMSMFLSGVFLLGVAGIIKLSRYDDLPLDMHVTNISDSSTPSTFSSINDIALVSSSMDLSTTATSSSSVTYQQNVTEQHTPEPSDSLQLSTTAVLSIIGFSCIDIGFDMSISITRAYILESVPSFQHTRLLVMATVVASMAGSTFSFLGCFDFPGALGPLFHVEGVAVTLVFFCALLFTFVVVGYSLTISTGYLINRKSREDDANKSQLNAKPQRTAITTADNNGSQARSRKRVAAEKPQQKVPPNPDRPYVPDILHTEERDPSTRPLLLESSLKVNNYWALSVSTSSIIRASDLHEPRLPAGDVAPSDISASPPKENPALVADHDDNNSDALSNSETHSEFQNNRDHESNEQNIDNVESSLVSAIRQSCSMSMSVGRPRNAKLHTRNVGSLHGQKLNDPAKDDTKFRMNKRLTILCFSCFFTSGGMITFIVYISNALNIGIFHGDPTSKPGTEAYDLYQSGLRTAALGNLVLYVTYMIISVNNTRLINLIGEKGQFVACHAFLIVSLLTLLLTERVEVYFVFMVSCGGVRTCVFTLPFVLANKFTQDEGSTDSGKESKHIGKVMSLIGFLIPAHYIILSAFMGPLMDATGSVWVPLIYSLCSCSMSLLIFSSLFFVKN